VEAKTEGKKQGCIISTRWSSTEATPAFKRLMMLLLKPVDNQSAETMQAVEEQQNE